MKKTFFMLLVCLGLSACSQDFLGSPCPNYGAHCRQLPINSWDFEHASIL